MLRSAETLARLAKVMSWSNTERGITSILLSVECKYWRDYCPLTIG